MKSNITSDNSGLLEKVVEGGYCSGCGACAAVKNSPYVMQLNEDGFLIPALENVENQANIDSMSHICPFYASENEDVIARSRFDTPCQKDDQVGFWLGTYAGYANEGDYREKGSSGGMGTWLIAELFSQNLIDSVIHVREHSPIDSDRRLFKYAISRSVEEAALGAKSKYYPVEVSEVIQQVREQPGKYAFVGLPCFVKATRLLAKSDEVLNQRFRYYVGLVCGHLKSSLFADYIGWQFGVVPGNLSRIDFRYKVPSLPAREYSILLEEQIAGSTSQKVVNIKDVLGYDWGKGFFKYEACDYCDDVFAETADIVIGDAWLQKYVNDPLGTNIVITRLPELDDLLTKAAAEQRLFLEPLPLGDAILSQAGGLMHRRQGLAHRLGQKKKQGKWYPEKRVSPGQFSINKKYRAIFSLRQELREESFCAYHQALAKDDFSVFVQLMSRLISKYDTIYYRRPLFQHIKAKLGRVLRKMGIRRRSYS